MQTKFGMPEGNCFAACLATLLGLYIEEVPEFQWGPDGELDGDRWWQRTRAWLKDRGIALIQLDLEDRPGMLHMLPYGLPMMVGGQSHRGDFLHSVIYMNGDLWHDPHPDGIGLKGDPVDVCILAPLKPWNISEFQRFTCKNPICKEEIDTRNTFCSKVCADWGTWS